MINLRLPWWGGVLLAIISYSLLHAYTAAELSSQEIGTGNTLLNLALIGQYLIPGAFLLYANFTLIRHVFVVDSQED